MAIAPVSESSIGTNIRSHWQNSHVGFLTAGMRAIMGTKDKCKLLELPLPRKVINQKKYCIPGGVAEIGAHNKGLKSGGW